MAKKRREKGTLAEPVSCEITTQEQAYKVITCIPGISKTGLETMREAIVTGPDQYWVRMSLTYGHLPEGTKSRKKALQRLSESDHDAMLQVLDLQDGKVHQAKIAARFAETAEGSLRALHRDKDWTMEEVIVFLKMALPTVDDKEAARLLHRSCVISTPPEHRSKVVFAVRKWPYDPVPRLLWRGYGRPTKSQPQWTPEERAHLLHLIAMESAASYDLLFPYTWETRSGMPILEGSKDAALTRAEKLPLAEKAGQRLRAEARGYPQYRSQYQEQARLLLGELREGLSAEVVEYLEKLVASK